jgi:hypothetical protein
VFQVRAVDLTGNVKAARTLSVALGVNAAPFDTVVALADIRGVLPGSTLTLTGDPGLYPVIRVGTIAEGGLGAIGEHTGAAFLGGELAGVLGGDLVEGTLGIAAFTSAATVLATADSDAGWSEPVFEYPSLVGQPDVGANAILANMILAGEIKTIHLESEIIRTEDLIADGVIKGRHIDVLTINAGHIASTGLDAEQIRGGDLTIGGPTPAGDERTNPQRIRLLDPAGNEIALLDVDGMLLKDSTNPLKQLRWNNGVLTFTEDGWITSGVAIDGRGIVADSILVGTAPGGHNSIPNSSFERTPLVAAATSKVWTSAVDWQAHLASTDINIDDSATELKLSSVAY